MLPLVLGLLGANGILAMRDAQAQQQAATDMRGLIDSVGQLDMPQRGPALLEGLMRQNPKLAERYGGQLAEIYQGQSRINSDAQDQQVFQARMSALNDTLAQLPEAQHPAAVARLTNAWGPDFTRNFLEFQQQTQRQAGSMAQIGAHGEQQSQMQRANTDLENLRTGNNMNEIRLRDQLARRAEAARAAAGAAAGPGGPAGPQLGAVGAGMARVVDPATGIPTDVGLPGSAPHNTALEAITSNERAIARLQELARLVQQHGTETMPGPVKARMASLWGMATSDVAKARNMGVMQPGELAAVQSQMPDPSAIGSMFSGASGEALGAYQQLLEEQMVIHQRNQSMFGRWPGLQRAPPVGVNEVLIAPGKVRNPMGATPGRRYGNP